MRREPFQKSETGKAHLAFCIFGARIPDENKPRRSPVADGERIYLRVSSYLRRVLSLQSLAAALPQNKIKSEGGQGLNFFNRKSISVTYLLLVVLMITMSSWNLFTYYKDIRGKSAENIVFQQRMIDASLGNIQKLFQLGQQEAALAIIDANYSSNFFDFYVVLKRGQILSSSSNIGTFDINSIPPNAHNFEIKTPENTFYLYRAQAGDYDFVLGYFPADTSSLSLEEIWRIFTHNVQDTAILFFAITGLVLREYFRQIRAIKRGRREDLEKMNPMTTEGKLLKELFLHASNLTRQKIELEVPDGVEIELSRGTQDRTIFKGAIIRIDLNQYSKLCKELGQARVDSMLSPVFSDFREVAQRYGFYEVADEGDERVFYLRSDDHEEATRLGLSVIRGMFELGRTHAVNLKADQGVDFKFKASYSYDDLLFVKEDGKYKLKGNAHIISKRCIGTFKERQEKEFVVALPQKDFIGCEFLCGEPAIEDYDLQGLGHLDIVFINQLKETPEDETKIPYFRSNEEISIQLTALQNNWSEQSFWALYRSLKDLKLISKLESHSKAALNLLEEADDRGASAEIVASLIMLVQKLTPATEVTPSVEESLRKFLKSENPRVRANALEALGELKESVEDARRMLSAEDNRTKANALLILGKAEMNSDVEKALRKFLRSGSENEVLSGLFVVDKLFAYHSHRDLTFFKTSSFFKDLFSDVTKLRQGSTAKVKSKADLINEIHGDLLKVS